MIETLKVNLYLQNYTHMFLKLSDDETCNRSSRPEILLGINISMESEFIYEMTTSTSSVDLTS